MTVRLHDSLTKRAEPVAADRPLGVYSCGPTVYDRIHVGNARPFVVAMVLKRHLDRQGVAAKVVINVTDVNDKIYIAARERGVSSTALAAEMTAAYFADTGRLGLGRPDVEPLVTETMPEIVALIERLIEKGFAYEANGDVYFAVRSFPSYGDLSGQKPDEMLADGRVEPGEGKRSPLDFALWKATKEGEDTSWESPWGLGRPGWHIECSAMAEKTLGPEFLIHGGGLDLVFPHHENERAQSQAVGRPFARIWMHNGLLRFTGEKMSKSVGNVATIQEVIAEWGREAALLFLMTGHWRKPLEFSQETMAAASAQVESFREAFRKPRQQRIGAMKADWEAFARALDDDFNTPEALAIMHGWRAHGFTDWLERGLRIFGLGSLAEQREAPAAVVALAEKRQTARSTRDFAESDRLRDEIAGAGWEVRDVSGGFELVPLP